MGKRAEFFAERHRSRIRMWWHTMSRMSHDGRPKLLIQRAGTLRCQVKR